MSCNEGEIYEAKLSRCCKICPAGQGVSLPCNEENDTVCNFCQEGKTFSLGPSHEETCQSCSICPENAKIRHQCNSTHNTKCECVRGFFIKPEANRCVQCKKCQPGEEAIRSCSPLHDTVCQACPNGFFSTASTPECRPCSQCGPNVTARFPCSSTHDTICEGRGKIFSFSFLFSQALIFILNFHHLSPMAKSREPQGKA